MGYLFNNNFKKKTASQQVSQLQLGVLRGQSI